MTQPHNHKAATSNAAAKEKPLSFAQLLAAASGTQKPESWNGIKLYVYDPKTEKTLLDVGADAAHDPASLSKLAFFYVLQTAMRDGATIKPDDTLKVPNFSYATRINGVNTTQKLQATYLKTGNRVTVSELIEAMMVKSDNGAAQMLAEEFERKTGKNPIDLMNALGLKSSRFNNVGGLPADQDPNGTKKDEAKITTARDMAILMQQVRSEFPEAMADYMTKAEATYDNKTHKANHFLLDSKSSLKLPEGFTIAAKTGFVNASGHNIATLITAPNGNELIAVVLGSSRRWAIDTVKKLGLMNDDTIKEDVVDNSIRGNRVRDALVQQLAKHYLGGQGRTVTLGVENNERAHEATTTAAEKLPATLLKEARECGQQFAYVSCTKTDAPPALTTRPIKPSLGTIRN